jgi:hypothetical protein
MFVHVRGAVTSDIDYGQVRGARGVGGTYAFSLPKAAALTLARGAKVAALRRFLLAVGHALTMRR